MLYNLIFLVSRQFSYLYEIWDFHSGKNVTVASKSCRWLPTFLWNIGNRPTRLHGVTTQNTTIYNLVTYSSPLISHSWKIQYYLTSDYKIIANMQKFNPVKLQFYYHQAHNNKIQGRLLLSLHILVTLSKVCISECLVWVKIQFLYQIQNIEF
jgi:hypothetical protein